MDIQYIQNYDVRMEEMIKQYKERGQRPRLLLHSCCAPCSSAVLERIAKAFEITVFYFNPNIEPEEEYGKRVQELEKLLECLEEAGNVSLLAGRYQPQEFYDAVKGLEHSGEGGERCYRCYELRLRETAKIAKEQDFDCFTTTLSISPYKRADWLNEIGQKLSSEYNVEYLYSDFKKKNGYRRSIELSKEYGLYRQDYCGCRFSKEEREQVKQEKRRREQMKEQKNQQKN